MAFGYGPSHAHIIAACIASEFAEVLTEEEQKNGVIPYSIARADHRLLQAQHLRDSQPCPINRLPNELILAIFMAGNTLEEQWKNTLSPPVRFSHVCRLWRAISLDSAGLWTRICMTARKDMSVSVTHGMRSKNLPLRVHLDCTRDELTPNQAALLINVSPRITEVTMEACDIIFVHRMQRYMETAPCLRRFEYRVPESSPSAHQWLAHNSTYRASILPTLQCLKADFTCWRCLPSMDGLVYLSLANLSLDGGLLNIVTRKCPNLITLALPRLGPATMTHSSEDLKLVRLTSLKKLAFGFKGMPPLQDLANIHLYLPNLEYLEIFGDFSYPKILDMFSIPDGCNTPFPRLETVHLQNTIESMDEHVPPFLQSIGTLRHLVLTDRCGRVDTMVKGLDKLQSLHINYTLVNGQLFASGLASHIRQDQPLVGLEELCDKVHVRATEHSAIARVPGMLPLPPGEFKLLTREDMKAPCDTVEG
ncbi:hypothetical protein GGF50DRAFT_53508 [Schizophyllum commune]